MKTHGSLAFLASLGFAFELDALTPFDRGFEAAMLVSPHQQANAGFGSSLGATDVDLDGIPDILVGAVFENPGGSPRYAGRAYVFSGGDRSLLLELSSPNEQEIGFFGAAVSGAPDMDGDGFTDVIVGAPRESPGSSPDEAGRAYVFSGRNGALLHELAAAEEHPTAHFGDAVASAGDLDRDGAPDILVWGHGRVHVFSSRDATLLLEVSSPNEGFDAALGGAGDVDGDGFEDWIVGAPFESDAGRAGAGRAYVFSGNDASLIHELHSVRPEPNGLFGNAVSGAGDVDRDGHADLLVGALQEQTNESPDDAGRAYVFSGRDGSLLFQLRDPHEEPEGYFGLSVSSIGDLDQDGSDDVMVGSFAEPAPSPRGAGRAHVFGGRDGRLLLELLSPNEMENSAFGSSVACAGDLNGDGVADPIVSAVGENPGVVTPFAAGRVYLFLSTGFLGPGGGR